MKNDTYLLVATVKNEGPNILEWVAHHRLCGFDRIQIYQNDSTDSTVQTLRTLHRMGVIEYFDNRHMHGAHQMRAYRRAARTETYAEAEWCMVLDGDEFLNVKAGDGGVRDLVAACPDASDAILVNWRIFGSGGHRDLDDILVTKRFTSAEPEDEIVDGKLSPFKPLFRTAAFRRPGIHLPRDQQVEEPVYCNGSGLLEGEFFRKNWRSFDPRRRQHAQVNHYMVRDLSSFLLKHDRGSANAPNREVGKDYWDQHDRNEAEDDSLASRAPVLWAEMERLDEMSGGRLLRLRGRAMRQARIAVAALLERPDTQALHAAILGEAPAPAAKEQASMITPFRLPGPQPVFSTTRTGKAPPLILPKPLAV